MESMVGNSLWKSQNRPLSPVHHPAGPPFRPARARGSSYHIYTNHQSSSTNEKGGKNLVGTWVEHGRKMVGRYQPLSERPFWPFFGRFELVFSTLIFDGISSVRGRRFGVDGPLFNFRHRGRDFFSYLKLQESYF